MPGEECAPADGRDADGVYTGNFAKALQDDTIEYTVYVINDEIKTEATLRERLKLVQTALDSLVKSLTKNHIWERENFSIGIENAHRDSEKQILSLLWSLHGRTNFGDSISDEWLIVHILRQISEQFKDVWIRVTDNDGEFLLVEAAKALPAWLDPEIASNRVWIHDGRLQIIPDGPNTKITLEKAVQCIQQAPQSLLHAPAIEDAAFSRLKEYPEAIASSLHNALVMIPRRLAHLLHHNPAYICPAVQAFYLRDVISLRPLSTKDTATLSIPPEDFVTVSVKFTRLGYAQLRSQDFPPPPSWTAVAPHVKDTKVDIGMKVACGMEMLLQDKQNQDRREVREIKLLLEDIDSGEDSLPTDATIKSWSLTQDDEGWLHISFEDLERELDGTGHATSGDTGTTSKNTDDNAQANLRKMVSRFETFLADDKAGLDGIDNDCIDLGGDDSRSSTESSEADSEGEDKEGSFNEAEFEQAMREMMGLPPEEREKRGLVDEARKLALEMEDEMEGERDEDADTKKVMDMMERELKGRGALDIKDLKRRAETKEQQALIHRGSKNRQPFNDENEDDDEDDEDGLGELSSDDDNEDNDVDVNMLRNLLESLRSEGGMSGPASNMLASMGIRLPRDDEDVKRASR